MLPVSWKSLEEQGQHWSWLVLKTTVNLLGKHSPICLHLRATMDLRCSVWFQKDEAWCGTHWEWTQENWVTSSRSTMTSPRSQHPPMSSHASVPFTSCSLSQVFNKLPCISSLCQMLGWASGSQMQPLHSRILHPRVWDRVTENFSRPQHRQHLGLVCLY